MIRIQFIDNHLNLVISGFLFPLIIFASFCGSLLSDEPPSLPMYSRPADAELENAKQVVNSLFADDYNRATTAATKIVLAKKLLETGINTTDDPAGCFWLLSESHRLAIEVGQVSLAFETADALGGRFHDTESISLRAAACELLSSDKYPITTSKQIAESSVENIEYAISLDQFEVAKIFIKTGLTASERLGNSEIGKALNQLSQDIDNLQMQRVKYDNAIETLKTQSDDLNANRVVGTYLALRHNNWVESEKHLRRIGEMNLRSIVSREFGKPTTVEEWVRLADDWWKIAEEKSGAEQLQAKARSVLWYKQSINRLEGLTKRKIQERINSVSDEAIARIHPPMIRGEIPKDSNESKTESKKYLKPIVNSVGMALNPIPAGEFMMGSPPNDSFVKKDERPQHPVKISKPFFIGAYEVTHEQYAKVMGRARPSAGVRNHAVGAVSWEDAQVFCQKLSELPDEKNENRVYRLPTEAEWEYACRAGSTTRYYFGDDPSRVDEYAWNAGSISTVGTKKPNAWGLYDMQGNATEWCSDWYSDTYYQNSPKLDPKGPKEGRDRVHRGSSWGSPPKDSRSASRSRFNTTQRYPTVGFRVVCDVK